MDESRRIRFLIPPVLFAASLLWGTWCDPQARTDLTFYLSDWNGASTAIKILAGGGVALLAAGYIFGTITYCALRLFFCFMGFCEGTSPFHEAAFSNSTLFTISSKLKWFGSRAILPEDALFGSVAFSDGVIRKRFEGIHEWLVRRWSGFNVACNSTTALICSIGFAPVVGIRHFGPNLFFGWMVPTLFFCTLLIFTAAWARADMENMFRFLAEREWPES